MKLFHGTNLSIDKIDLSKCRPHKDFGLGFYTTELEDQAIKMARRVARIYGGKPIVNVYEFDEAVLQSDEYSVKIFDAHPNEEWAKFVMNNRSLSFDNYADLCCNLDGKYDIVYGPIANDDMAVLFRQYENQMISFEMLVSGMTYKKLTNQCSFHTEKACELLVKTGENYYE